MQFPTKKPMQNKLLLGKRCSKHKRLCSQQTYFFLLRIGLNTLLNQNNVEKIYIKNSSSYMAVFIHVVLNFGTGAV